MTTSQLQRMRAEQAYNLFDPELVRLRQNAERLLFLFNHEPDATVRRQYLLELGVKLHDTADIQQPFRACYGCHISMGARSFINWDTLILDHGEVRIGEDAFIGPRVQIYTVTHPMEAEARLQGEETAIPVVMGDRIWIGGGAIILPGVHIGDEAVIGAGAVVTRSVPAGVRVGGNPAKPIGGEPS